MTLKRKLREQWMAGRAAAITAMLLGVAITPFPTPLERWSFDWPHAMQARAYTPEVAVVYLDELSHSKLGQSYQDPWDRKLHAELVDRLRGLGAKAIAFDIYFSEKGTEAGNAAFAAAIRKHGKVLLAADLGSRDHIAPSEVKLELPHPELLAATPYWGFSQLLPADSREVVIREHFHGGPDIPSLSWKMAEIMGADTTRTPRSQRQKRWLHYYGPNTIPAFSYYDVCRGAGTNLMADLRDRVVFIGSGSTEVGFSGQRRDQFSTPYWLERPWPGVDFHATQFLNLLRHDWLRRPDPFIELALIAVCGILAGLGFARLRPLQAVGAAVVTMLLILLCASALMWQQYIWLNWMVIAGVQIPIGLAFVLVRQQRGAMGTDATLVFAPGSQQSLVPDHELVRKIGGGSYGEVWLARSVTGSYRAVKLVDAGSPKDPRLEREFAGLKKFEPVSREHPGLVQILHVGRNETTGQLYYVMELADSCAADANNDPNAYAARTLQSELQMHDGLAARESTELSVALTAALAFLHEHGLIHRDIKPSNIIFVGGRPKLADIGLVAARDETMSFVGTAGYIPPEGPGTTAADVYSLGKVLSELVAATHNAPVLDALHAVVGKATAENVAHRYPTATQMFEALKAALADYASGEGDATRSTK